MRTFSLDEAHALGVLDALGNVALNDTLTAPAGPSRAPGAAVPAPACLGPAAPWPVLPGPPSPGAHQSHQLVLVNSYLTYRNT